MRTNTIKRQTTRGQGISFGIFGTVSTAIRFPKRVVAGGRIWSRASHSEPIVTDINKMLKMSLCPARRSLARVTTYLRGAQRPKGLLSIYLRRPFFSTLSLLQPSTCSAFQTLPTNYGAHQLRNTNFSINPRCQQ